MNEEKRKQLTLKIRVTFNIVCQCFVSALPVSTLTFLKKFCVLTEVIQNGICSFHVMFEVNMKEHKVYNLALFVLCCLLSSPFVPSIHQNARFLTEETITEPV